MLKFEGAYTQTKASVDKDSKEPYDQLAKAEADKLQKVLDFIKSDL